MKHISKELDVDYLGGQHPLTKEEELRISEYIRNLKQRKSVGKKQSAAFSAKRKKQSGKITNT